MLYLYYWTGYICYYKNYKILQHHTQMEHLNKAEAKKRFPLLSFQNRGPDFNTCTNMGLIRIKESNLKKVINR